MKKTDDKLIIMQTSLLRTFLEILRCFAFFFVASCGTRLKPDDLWLIYKRGEGGKVGRTWSLQSTLLPFTIGLADIHSFTSPARQTSKFLIARFLKLCKPHYLPRGETKTKPDDLPG